MKKKYIKTVHTLSYKNLNSDFFYRMLLYCDMCLILAAHWADINWWRCVLDFRCSLSWHLLMIVCAWFSLLVELTLMCADLNVCLFFSAGVGRTGVFITLSIVLERMRYEGVVDMFQTVKMLRTQRPAMVQTEVRNTANCYRDLLV